MNNRVVKLILVAFGTLVLWTASSATEPPPLSHNPFTRPPSEVAAPARLPLQVDGSPAALELRATLVGSKRNLADVAGNVLRPGDEVQGYKLLQVFENRAVFERAGTRLTIYVKPELEENDE